MYDPILPHLEYLAFQMNTLIIEDHPLLILGIKFSIIDIDPEVNIFTASSFPNGLAMLGNEVIDIVILDIDIPRGQNLKMLERIREVSPHTLILIYSAYEEELYAIPYLQAGANGYLTKQSSSDEFKAAFRTVLDGKKYISRKMQQVLVDNSGEHDVTSYLTTAEFKVMLLLIEGKWTKEIALILNLKQNTVSTYKKRIFDKMGVRDAIELSKKLALLSINKLS